MLGNILTFERLFKIKRLSVAPGLRKYDDDGNNDGDIFFFWSLMGRSGLRNLKGVFSRSKRSSLLITRLQLRLRLR